jgi:branched-chain amino acid transport system ATP-binding protein
MTSSEPIALADSSPDDSRSTSKTLLTIRGLNVTYGAVRAVRGVDLEVASGQIRVVLGANGAGKSSIIRSIIGVTKPASGTIEFPLGHDIAGRPPHAINSLGIGWVPEGRQIFANLTVQENLRIGGFQERRPGELTERLSQLTERFPRLQERRTQLAGSLSGGEQQMLAIARALMSSPRLLLLDEPSLGLAPKIVDSMFELVCEIRDSGISVLMAEQNARHALRIADYAYLLENGEMRGHGTPQEMEQREDVRAAYLGG